MWISSTASQSPTVKEEPLLSGGPHYPTATLPPKKNTQLVCEPEGDEETEASSLATSILWVSLRDGRGSTSRNSGVAILVPPEGHHQVCRGSEGNFIKCAKAQGGRGNRGGSPQAIQQTAFPGPSSDVDSQPHRIVKGQWKW